MLYREIIAVCSEIHIKHVNRLCGQNVELLNVKIDGIYRVIHKSLRDFQPLRYSSRDGHAEGEHINRGRDTPSFCTTLQVLDMSTFGDAADVNPVIKFGTLWNIWQSIAATASTILCRSCVCVSPMPRDLPQLRRRIVEAVAAIDRQILQPVWQEIDYRTDILMRHQGWAYRAPVR
jgi:hypothetical protein